MAESITLTSSLRQRSPERTIEVAKSYAARLGITRVTDITRLDRIGIPVFVSIRPNAMPGSLCVNGGKGVRPVEAEAGAYMEAIEYAMIEPVPARVPIQRAKARDVLDGRRRHDALLELCPNLGVKIRLDARMSCVEATEIVRGDKTLIPAEIAFCPFPMPQGEKSCFSSNTNGVASGNTLREATVHGLAELIERDVTSLDALRDESVLVDLETVRGPAEALIRAIREARLDLYVRTVSNAFDIPYFKAVLHDPDSDSPRFVNGGFGCHPHRSIALVRAVSEAVQSRLSCIHGGRDDLTRAHDAIRRWSPARKRAHIRRVVAAAAASTGRALPFGDLVDWSAGCVTLERCEQLLLERLHGLGFDRTYRVVFSRPADDLQVVRVVVPGLEFFNETAPRLGRRLREHARAA